MEKRIRSIEVTEDKDGKVESVNIIFGPHYFLDIRTVKNQLMLFLGATHHGFRAEAFEVGGELEKFINIIREKYPENCID